MKTIEVIIKPGGGIVIDAVGFQGADCEKATEFLEKALGQAREKRKKPEHYRRTVAHQQIGGA